MEDKINQELLKLENELSALDNAVKQITKAEKLSSDVVAATQAIHSKYKTHLNEVMLMYSDFLKKTQTTAENQLNSIFASHQSQIAEVSKILTDYADLAQLTAHLQEKIEKVDFATPLNDTKNSVFELQKQVNENHKDITEIENRLNQTTEKNTVELLNKLIAQDKKLSTIESGVKTSLEGLQTTSDTMITAFNRISENSEKRYADIMARLNRNDKRIRSTRRWVIFSLIIGICLIAAVAFGYLQLHGYDMNVTEIME